MEFLWEKPSEKNVAASKQNIRPERNDVLEIEGMDQFGDGMTIVKGSRKVSDEDVTQEIVSELGKLNGIK